MIDVKELTEQFVDHRLSRASTVLLSVEEEAQSDDRAEVIVSRVGLEACIVHCKAGENDFGKYRFASAWRAMHPQQFTGANFEPISMLLRAQKPFTGVSVGIFEA